jgi:hypothetical protein
MRWTFWERVGAWIVGIAAIIEAIDGALRNAPNLSRELPDFQIFFSFAPLALVIFAVGIFVALKLGWLKRTADSAQFELRFNLAGQSVPDVLSYRNTWRWYILHSTARFVTPQGVTAEAKSALLVLTFEPDVAITTIRCNSPDSVIPKYEVKEFNQRFAVIVFDNELPKGTLQIRVGV